MVIEYLRLHHVQICIPTGKEEQAKQFYMETLGFVEIEKPEALKKNGGFWLKVADIELHIGTEDTIFPGKRHPAFEVNNLNEVRAYLENRDITIQEETQIEGFQRFSFFDPFSNRIEFISPLAKPDA